MVAAIAEAVIGPNPGMLISRRAVSSYGRSRRKPAVADRDLGRLNWAESAP
jgi:hypothetical protein